MTDRFSNVPPEVLQVLTKSPPYSPGEEAILRAYALRVDANPEIVFSIDHLLAPQAASRPEPSGGAGTPTLDFLSGLNVRPYDPEEQATLPGINVRPSAFHEDLKHQGAADINFDNAAPATPVRPGTNTQAPAPASLGPGGSTLDFLSPIATWANIRPYDPEEQKTLPGINVPSSETAPRTRDRWGEIGPTPDSSGPAPNTNWRQQMLQDSMNLPSLAIDPNSAFAGIGDLQLGTVARSPELMANYLYPDAPLSAASRQQWLSDVAMLAQAGLLTNTPNATIFSGRPTGDVQMLEQVEAMNDAFQGKGKQVDPRALYQEAFRRLLNSNAHEFVDEDTGGTKGDAPNQVAVTNGLLAQVTPFVFSGSQEGYIQRLNSAGMQYLTEYTAGRTDLTYPEWLKAQGALDWL